MSIVAVAFHQHLKTQKLKEFYASPQVGPRTKHSSIFCSRCLTEFVAVLMDYNDRHNANHLENLAAAIKEDCISRIHRDEYVLNAGD
jgi:hypothetical protein